MDLHVGKYLPLTVFGWGEPRSSIEDEPQHESTADLDSLDLARVVVREILSGASGVHCHFSNVVPAYCRRAPVCMDLRVRPGARALRGIRIACS